MTEPAPRPVRSAATVLLLRQGASGVEVFLQVRASSMAFAAGAAVFPGGSVDATDAQGTASWGLPDDASSPLGATGPEAGALYSAAIRETFEECGVLLALPAERALAQESGRGPDGARGLVELAADRAALSAHEASLAQVLSRRGLTPALSSLSCVDRWITPEGEPRRYDTRFFAAALPEGQEADGLTSESSHSFWSSPEQALNRFADGDLFLMPPTWAQLERLSRAGSVAEGLLPATNGVTVPTLEVSNGHPLAHFWGTEAYRAAAPRA